jgi:hypothetical protein
MEISGLLEPVAAPRAVSSLSRAFRRRCQWPFNLKLPVSRPGISLDASGTRAPGELPSQVEVGSSVGALALALWHGQPALKLPRVRLGVATGHGPPVP